MPSTNVDAHTLATSVRYFSLTLSTQPASMTQSSCCQLLSSFRGTSFSGCCSALATQSGVNAWTTAASALASSISPAVPPVTQPPQAKPTTIAAIAPPIAPHTAGFTDAGTFIANLLLSVLDCTCGRHSCRGPRERACPPGRARTRRDPAERFTEEASYPPNLRRLLASTCIAS